MDGVVNVALLTASLLPPLPPAPVKNNVTHQCEAEVGVDVMKKRKPLALSRLRTVDLSARNLVAIPTQLQSDMNVKVKDLKCDKFFPSTDLLVS
jgi:hypothetical protein